MAEERRSGDQFEDMRRIARWHRDQAALSAQHMQKHNEAADLFERAADLGTYGLNRELLRADQPEIGSLHEIITSGRPLMKGIEQSQFEITTNVNALGTAALNCAAITNSLGVTWAQLPEVHPDCLHRLDRLQEAVKDQLRRENYEEKIERIDPELVATYRQARQQLTASGPEAGRPALNQVSGLWDTLFRRLAPDEEVRKEFKLDAKSSVERRHCLEYVIRRWVRPLLRDSMRQSVNADLRTHKRLYHYHNSPPLNNAVEITNAREVLVIIHRWLDAILL